MPKHNLPHWVELIPFHAPDCPVTYMARVKATKLLYDRHQHNANGDIVNYMTRRQVQKPLIAGAYEGRKHKSGKVWASKKPVHNKQNGRTTKPNNTHPN